MSNELLQELRARLVNIELKINSLSGIDTDPSSAGFFGHPDQAFGHVSYAQHGEDMIIVNAFALLSIPRPSYIDVGAHHPINISNTALLHARGSRGINIEANPVLIKAFHDLRPEDTNLNIGIGSKAGDLDFYFIDEWSGRNTFDKSEAEAFVKAHPSFKITKVEKIRVRTLDDVIASEAGGIWPDFMSIDIEGWDYAVLEASSMRSGSGPKIVCVETVSANTADRSANVRDLLAERGYASYVRTIGNTFLVDKAFIDQLR